MNEEKITIWEELLHASQNSDLTVAAWCREHQISIDNNAAEQSIRGFCIGKKNWVMIDTIAGAESSAI